MNGRATGRVMVRPVRAGFVFDPSAETLRLAVEQATLLWGGQYQPFLQPGDAGFLEETARALGIDVLLSLDGSAASQKAAALDGFHWSGRERWGALAQAQDYTSRRLLGPERLLDGLSRDFRVLPEWAADDPLDDLFRVWFGTYGTSPQGTGLHGQFAVGAKRVVIASGADVPPSAASWVTPATATGMGIDYKGQSPGAALVIIDPADPASLAALWNARACGAPAFPIPVGHEGRVLAAVDFWLRRLLTEESLGGWRTGDGRPLGPRIHAWQAREADGLPEVISELLKNHGVTAAPIAPETGLWSAGGWYGEHPLTTDYVLTFSQPLEEDGRLIRVPVPEVGSGRQDSSVPHGDVVAVQVRISDASGVRPDWTFSVPGKRSYSGLLRQHDGVLLAFDRPVEDGRVLSASSGDREVAISALPSAAIIDRLLEAPGWSARRTPGGVFVTRLIERLGGMSSTIANQPGARAALLDAAASPRGLPSGAIVQAVKRWKGDWPGTLRGDASRYPADVFQFLLRQAILRPVLPVDCPYCTSSIAYRPEDLTGQMKCEMCLREFPLGLALGMKANGKNDWLYQVAGHVAHDRLSEALPVMATLQVLHSRKFGRAAELPYVLGWKVKGPRLDCEVDIAAVMDYHGVPALVIGEVKSWKDSIDANDLSNLQKIQQHVRKQGTECLILAAVLRNDLRDEEMSALRDLAQHPSNTILTGSAIESVLPIVLTGKDLSAVWSDQNHPSHWSPADGVLGMAKQSCRVNLGMTGLEPDPDSEEFRFRPVWPSPAPEPHDSEHTDHRQAK